MAVRLDRIGRGTKNLIDVFNELEAKGADAVILDQGIDTTTPAGRFVFRMFASIAEFERDLIIERTRDGLARTTARGRKHRLTPQQVTTARKLRADGHSVREIGELLGNGRPVSRQTIYRALGMTSDSKEAI